MSYSFNFRDVWRYREMLLDGAVLTLQLSAATMLLGLGSRARRCINAATFEPLLVYSFVAVVYFVICFSLSQLSLRLEGRLHVAR